MALTLLGAATLFYLYSFLTSPEAAPARHSEFARLLPSMGSYFLPFQPTPPVTISGSRPRAGPAGSEWFL